MADTNIGKPVKEVSISRQRRKLLLAFGTTGIVAAGMAPKKWSTPVINSVVLPAHAQTSICVTDTTRAGPLIGHPSGAMNCADACDSEATSLSGQLCNVEETVDGMGATQCSCDIDLP